MLPTFSTSQDALQMNFKRWAYETFRARAMTRADDA